jgi:hypothetical protein
MQARGGKGPGDSTRLPLSSAWSRVSYLTALQQEEGAACDGDRRRAGVSAAWTDGYLGRRTAQLLLLARELPAVPVIAGWEAQSPVARAWALGLAITLTCWTDSAGSGSQWRQVNLEDAPSLWASARPGSGTVPAVLDLDAGGRKQEKPGAPTRHDCAEKGRSSQPRSNAGPEQEATAVCLCCLDGGSPCQDLHMLRKNAGQPPSMLLACHQCHLQRVQVGQAKPGPGPVKTSVFFNLKIGAPTPVPHGCRRLTLTGGVGWRVAQRGTPLTSLPACARCRFQRLRFPDRTSKAPETPMDDTPRHPWTTPATHHLPPHRRTPAA